MFEPLGASGCVREVRSEKEAPWKKCPQSNPISSAAARAIEIHTSPQLWRVASPSVTLLSRAGRGVLGLQTTGSAHVRRACGMVDSFRALQQAFVVVGSAQSSVSHRRSVAMCDHLARARARTAGFELRDVSSDRSVGGGPQGLGPGRVRADVCRGAGGSRCRDV